MSYHNLVKAGFGFCCALALGITISIIGDRLVSPKTSKAPGGVMVAMSMSAQK